MFHCEEKGSKSELQTTGAALISKEQPVISWRYVLSIVSPAMAKKAALTAIAITLATATALAQMVPLSSDIMRPTPGSGHDYVKGLNETVNPANGSLSISIQLPTLPSRGITLPFSIIYNSGIVHHMTVEEALGGTAAELSQDGTGFVPTDRSVNGWSDTVPYASVSSFEFVQSGSNFSITCIVSSSYTFYDARGQSSPLGVAALSPPGITGSVGNPNCANATRWNGVPSAAIDNYTTTLPGGNCDGSPSSPEDCAGAAPGFTVADPDGTVYTFNAGTYGGIEGPTASTFPLPSTIEDRNGNTMTLSGGPNGNGGYTPITVTDTSGRTAEKITYTTFGGSQVPQSYIVGGLTYSVVPTTTTASFKPTYEQVSPPAGLACKANFDVNDSSLNVVQAIDLPNGQQYSFQYDSMYGLVKEIDYPGGGWVKYNWGLNGSQTAAQAFPYSDFVSAPGYNKNADEPVQDDVCDYWYQTPAVLERQVGYTKDGPPALTQLFTYSTTPGSSFNLWGSKTTTINTTDNVTGQTYQTVYTYSPMDQIVSPLPPDAQYPVQVPVEQSIVYQGLNGETLKSVAKAWLDPNYLGCETDTEPNGTSGRWYGYNIYAEPDDLKEYDYGLISSSSCSANTVSTPPSGTPTRETATNYYTFSTSPNGGTLYDRPSTVQIYGAGSLAAETDYTYTPPVSPSAISAGQHDEQYYGPAATNLVRGNAIIVTRKCLTGCIDDRTQLAYDETGQVVSSKDANGNLTTYSFQDSGSGAGNSNAYLTLVQRPVTNGVSHNSSYQYNYSTGQLTSATDENQQTTNYYYGTPPAGGCSTLDKLDRLSEVDYPDTGKIVYCYNDAGLSMTTSTFATPDPTITRTTSYDGMGHTIQTELVSDPSGADYVDTTYDGEGRVASVSNPYRLMSDPTYGITRFTYDALGRKTGQLQADNTSSLTWCYDGLANYSVTSCPANLSSQSTDFWANSWDENGNRWLRTSDAFGRLTSVVEPNTAETDYTYNALNSLLSATQRGISPETPRLRSFSYDGLSRLVSAANPESGTVGYTYDGNGNVTTRTDARGIVTTYSYDALNRVVGKSYANDPANTPAVSYLWDISFHAGYELDPCCNNPIGHLTQALTTVNGSPLFDWMTLGYDQMERSLGYETCAGTSALNCQPLPTLIGEWDYDDAGHMWDMESFFQTSWNPVGGGFVDNSLVFDGAGNVASSTFYKAMGPLSQQVIVNAMANAAYTASGALSNAGLAPNAQSQPQITLTRSYDKRLRLTGETDTNSGQQAATGGSATVTVTGAEQTR